MQFWSLFADSGSSSNALVRANLKFIDKVVKLKDRSKPKVFLPPKKGLRVVYDFSIMSKDKADNLFIPFSVYSLKPGEVDLPLEWYTAIADKDLRDIVIKPGKLGVVGRNPVSEAKPENEVTGDLFFRENLPAKLLKDDLKHLTEDYRGWFPWHVKSQLNIDELESAMITALTRHESMRMHGTSGMDTVGKNMLASSGLEYQWILLNAVIEGAVNCNGGIGDLDGTGPYSPITYGPYYVLFHKDVEVEDGRIETRKWGKVTSISSDMHVIYLVPGEKDAHFIREGIKLAVQKDYMSPEDAEFALEKIMTYEELILAEKHLDLISSGAIPARAALELAKEDKYFSPDILRFRLLYASPFKIETVKEESKYADDDKIISYEYHEDDNNKIDLNPQNERDVVTEANGGEVLRVSANQFALVRDDHPLITAVYPKYTFGEDITMRAVDNEGHVWFGVLNKGYSVYAEGQHYYLKEMIGYLKERGFKSVRLQMQFNHRTHTEMIKAGGISADYLAKNVPGIMIEILPHIKPDKIIDAEEDELDAQIIDAGGMHLLLGKKEPRVSYRSWDPGENENLDSAYYGEEIYLPILKQNEFNPEFSYIIKDEYGRVQEEPSGFPGRWTVELKTAKTVFTDAAVLRMVKSFSIAAYNKGRDDIKCGKFTVVEKTSDLPVEYLLKADGVYIAKSEAFGFDMVVTEDFLTKSMSYQRDLFSGWMLDLPAPEYKVVNYSKTHKPLGRNPKALILNNIFEQANQFSVSPSSLVLAGLLKEAGCEIEVSDHNIGSSLALKREFEKQVSASDIICLSLFQDDLPYADALLGIIKRVNPEAVIVAGGHAVTVMPEHIMARLDEVDVFYRGEAENGFPEIIEALKGNGMGRVNSVIEMANDFRNVDGMVFRRGNYYQFNEIGHVNRLTDADLDKRKFDYEAFEKFDFNGGLHFMTSYGCPHNCSFCLTAGGKKTRSMSVEKIKELLWDYQNELERREELGIPISGNSYIVQLLDDNFFKDSDKAIKVLEMWQAEKVNGLKLKAHGIQTTITALLKKKAGSKEREANYDLLRRYTGFADIFEDNLPRILFGTDAVIADEIERIGKGPYTEEEIEKVLKACHETGIIADNFILLTNPQSRLGDIFKTLIRIFAIKVKNNSVLFFNIPSKNFFGFYATDGARVTNDLLREGKESLIPPARNGHQFATIIKRYPEYRLYSPHYSFVESEYLPRGLAQVLSDMGKEIIHQDFPNVLPRDYPLIFIERLIDHLSEKLDTKEGQKELVLYENITRMSVLRNIISLYKDALMSESFKFDGEGRPFLNKIKIFFINKYQMVTDKNKMIRRVTKILYSYIKLNLKIRSLEKEEMRDDSRIDSFSEKPLSEKALLDKPEEEVEADISGDDIPNWMQLDTTKTGRKQLAEKYTGYIAYAENLANILKDSFKAYMTSGKKLVIALEEGLGEESMSIDLIQQAVRKWKQEMLDERSRELSKETMQVMLDNIVLISFTDHDSFKTELAKNGIFPDDANSAMIYAFTKNSANVISENGSGERGIKPIIIHETKPFTDVDYYPILEIIALTLVKELFGVKVENNDLKIFGIEEFIENPFGFSMLFEILPAIKRSTSREQIDRLTEVLSHLRSL